MVGLRRLVGMMLPANGVRPVPSGLPVAGSKRLTSRPLKFPARWASVGTVASFVKFDRSLMPSQLRK